jgi:hypothetical protein
MKEERIKLLNGWSRKEMVQVPKKEKNGFSFQTNYETADIFKGVYEAKNLKQHNIVEIKDGFNIKDFEDSHR